MDGERTVEALKLLETGKAKDLHEEMKCLSAYLTWFSPSYIKCPFQANFLKSMNNTQDLLIADKDGNLAICRKKEKEMILQKNYSDLRITAVAVHISGTEIYLGTDHGQLLAIESGFLNIRMKAEVCKAQVLFLSTFSQKIIIGSSNGGLYSFVFDVQSPRPEKFAKFDSNITAMATNDSMIAVAADSPEIRIFSSSFQPVKSLEVSEEVTGLAWSNEDLVIAMGSDVKILNLKDHSFGYSCSTLNSNITSLAVFEELLMTGTADNSLKVWNLSHLSDEVTLFGHFGEVTQVVVENGIIHSLDSSGQIRVSRIPSFPYSQKVETSEKIHSIIYSNHLKTTLFIDSANKITSGSDGKVIFEKFHSNDILGTTFTSHDKVLIVFHLKDTSTCHILATFVDLSDDLKTSEVTLRASDVPSSFGSTETKKFLLTGEVCRITVWDANTGLQEYIFCTHSAKVTILSTSGSDLLAADEDGMIKTYNLDTLESKHSFAESSQSSIKQVSLHPNNKQLFVLSRAGNLKLLNLKLTSEIFEVSLGKKAAKLEFHRKGEYFFVSFESKIEVWNCESFTRVFIISFLEELKDFSLDHDQGKLICVFENHFTVLEIPFDAKLVTVYGKMDESHRFLQYLSEIFQGCRPKFSDRMNQFVIEPFNFNVLHVYAYFGMTEYIEKALQKDCGFFPSRLGFDPVQVAVETHNNDSLKALLNGLLNVVQESPAVFCHLSRSMTQLNYLSPEALPALYDLSFLKNVQNSIPRFCEDKVQLPIIKFSDSRVLSIDLGKFDTKEGRAIDFYQSFLHFNYTAGSSESINFLKSLTETKQLEVFNSLYLHFLLEHKWKKVRWVHFLDCLFYIVYLICLIFGVFSHKSHYLLIVSFSINQLLLIYEIFQMVASVKLYFRSFINYVDILRGLLFDLFCILEYFNEFEEYQNFLFLTTLFVSILRAFGYFKMFKATRWLIYLVLDIVVQLWSFIVVTIYIIMAFWIINFALQVSDKSLNFAADIKLNFMLFFFILIVNPLIIINLFINIVGNALEKINNEKGVKDLKEVSELVLEAEILMLWRRSSKKSSYFQVCATEQQTFISVNSLTEKIKRTAERVEVIQEYYNGNSQQLKLLKETLETSLSEIEGKLNKLNS
jgi:hypothetical protein